MSGARLPAVALAMLLALSMAGCRESTGRDGWDWNRMRDQRRADPYEASALFPDGKTMQSPPAGTVAREESTGDALIDHGMRGGAYAASIPLAVTPRVIALGRDRFGVFCAVCHGETGDGRSIVASNMVERPPPSLVSAPITSVPPGRIYQVVERGFGRMPPYAAQLSIEERWAVVAYVEQLQRGALGRATDTTTATPASVSSPAPLDSTAAPRSPSP